MLKHLELAVKSPMRKEHFDRWLMLWNETVKELYQGDIAVEAVKRAEQIAQLMLFKINQQ